MLPKKVKKRASLLAITLLVSVIGIFFILQSLNKNILYFKSPTDIKNNQNINFDKKIRVGGMVKKNSLMIKEEEINFIITDLIMSLILALAEQFLTYFQRKKVLLLKESYKIKLFL